MLRVAAVVVALAGGCGRDRPPSKDCRAAAETLVGFTLSNYAAADERARAVAPIERECASSGLSDAEAQCLASAGSEHAALRCPRLLTAELRAIDAAVGKGRCR